ncbi:MAG: hypothetical protein ICV79_25830 [Flavisolibacter sp.]|nr:hypothetical protein [Flavisolibacter sp.]
MKYSAFIIPPLMATICTGQPIDTTVYSINIKVSAETNAFFTRDYKWRGAGGASSIDLKNGKMIWLFSDGFKCSDSSGARNKSKIIHNSQSFT